MFEEMTQFLYSVYGEDKVALSYGDRVTTPGLSCIFYEDPGEEFDKNLDGTTNLIIGTFAVDIWHDSLEEVLTSSKLLIDKAEGTKYQLLSARPVREDGYKRKWHRIMQFRIMEDF